MIPTCVFNVEKKFGQITSLILVEYKENTTTKICIKIFEKDNEFIS